MNKKNKNLTINEEAIIRNLSLVSLLGNAALSGLSCLPVSSAIPGP